MWCLALGAATMFGLGHVKGRRRPEGFGDGRCKGGRSIMVSLVPHHIPKAVVIVRTDGHSPSPLGRELSISKGF